MAGQSEAVSAVATQRVGRDVWERYAEYLSRAPETVVEWNDPESPARGWLVINSLKGNAAGGGTRMRAGLTREEVVFLAKVMELKFAISGPPIGGAKSGLDFDPDDPRKGEVLQRWFTAIRPYLENHYSTAGDLNVHEVREVQPAPRAGPSAPAAGAGARVPGAPWGGARPAPGDDERGAGPGRA